MRSEHPLGKAIVTCYCSHADQEFPQAEQFSMLPGRGVYAVIEGKEIAAGNRGLLSEKNISLPEEADREITPYLEKGCTAIFLAIDHVLCGFLALSDTLRENAPGTIKELKEIGVMPVLLTGDHKNAAEYVADSLSIDSLFSDCLPEDKLEHIEEYQKKGKKVCMIGDGINDAPALKKAYVGIAMGKIGSDIAVDAADIALINDEITELPHLLRLAKRMMTTITCNLTFSMTLNFLAIILAMTGVLNPVVGALVHNAGSVAIIVNSAFLLNWRKKK